MHASPVPDPGGDVRLALEHIAKEFPDRSGAGTVKAVDDVSLQIRTGEFVTLLGPSGCGKTTTLRTIAGFETPTSGRILLDGRDITYQAPNKRDMALVFQNYALFPHMTVFDNIAYGLETRRLKKADIEVKVAQAMGLMGLKGLEARRPNQLSGGQQQRVALARSLVMEPRILLFDEPLSNLDAKLRIQMRGEIHRLQRRLNITTVYVTHDQTEAMALSDRIVVMNRGRIEQMGSPGDIYRYPATRFVADFIGRANFLPVEVLGTEGDAIQIDLLGKKLTLPVTFPSSPGAIVTAMLRPEALSLREDASLPQGTVEQAMYLGSEVEYWVSVDKLQLVVVDNDPTSKVLNEGQPIGIDFAREGVHLLPG